MIRFPSVWPVCVTYVLLSQETLWAEGVPADGIGQLGAAIRWIDVPGSPDSYFMTQRSRDGLLFLAPNEAFFPKLGLVAEGTGITTDIQNLNGGKSFAAIGRWEQEDVAEWGVFLENSGLLKAHLWITATDNLGKYSLQLGETTRSVTTAASAG